MIARNKKKLFHSPFALELYRLIIKISRSFLEMRIVEEFLCVCIEWRVESSTAEEEEENSFGNFPFFVSSYSSDSSIFCFTKKML
jgi:hypothetical protein